MSFEIYPNGATLARLSGPTRDDPVVVRAQNFLAQWVDDSRPAASFASMHETMVILFSGHADLGRSGATTAIDEPAVAIVPAGETVLRLGNGGSAVILATDRTDASADAAMNAPLAVDSRVAPVGRPFERVVPLDGVQVMPFASLSPPADNGRLRFVQSATISINLVLYDGPRGSGSLSPHAHDDIEQGTLAVSGRYVHHLRTPWGRDAATWRDDQHLDAAPGTLLLIPPHLIHTTEGVGDGAHVLVDIFAPPRRDFIAKGWIMNASDYVDAA